MDTLLMEIGITSGNAAVKEFVKLVFLTFI
jgi:hypothetical protein